MRAMRHREARRGRFLRIGANLPATGGSRPARAAVALAALLALGACGTAQRLGEAIAGPPPGPRGFLGAVAAEEPRAALVARDVLAAGGNAADAAVAAGFALAVTLPSRATLGGGGACLIHDPRRGAEAVLFPPGARGAVPAGADRPAAVPLLARGLFLVHSRSGRTRFEELLRPAEDLARGGMTVSRAFAADLAAVAGPLAADPVAREVFFAGGTRPPEEGTRLIQPGLAATLGQMRSAGVGELHQGLLARRLAEASVAAGGGLTIEELRAGLPRTLPAVSQPLGGETLSALPTPGGEAALAALAGDAASRFGGAFGASTSLAVMDRQGGAVACVFTANNLFGTGRVAAGTGILLAAAPGAVPAPPLAALMLHGRGGQGLRAVAAGSGQAAAPEAAALPFAAFSRGTSVADSVAVAPEPGRSLLIGCRGPVVSAAGSCAAAADPRGAGLGLLVGAP